MSTLDTYRDRVAGLAEDKILGAILWFTVNRPRVTVAEMGKWFVELGLDERYLPNEIKPVDAYRKATGEAKCEYPLRDDKQSVKLVFEEVAYDDDTVERHLIRMKRDARKRTLEHQKVGEAIFYRQSRNARKQGVGGERVRFSIQAQMLESDEEAAKVKQFLDDVHTEYEMLKQFPTADAIRGTVRNYVQSLNAIPVRPSGGVYFVHKSRQDTVDGLQEFVRRISNGSTIHTLPLVDTGEQREMLADSFQEEVKDKCDKLLGEVARLNDKYKGAKKVPAAEYAKASAAYADLSERAREYTDILQLGLGSAATALEAALDSVTDLATRIDTKGA